MQRIILFANKNKEYNWLSNFSNYPIIINRITYPTVEHYYQSEKTLDQSQKDKIIGSKNGYDAMRFGRQADQRKDWETIKFDVMQVALLAKIEQNPIIRELLDKTKGYILIEDTNNDVWGRGRNGKGSNMLGKMWMQLRDSYV